MNGFKVLKLFLIIMSGILQARATLSLESAEVRVLDESFGKCNLKIIPTNPKSIDLDVNSLFDAKEILLQFGAFSYIDGKYNEVIETDKVSICNISKSDNPLVQLVYIEMGKVGNLTTACPIVMGHYYIQGLTINESDVPIPLPPGNFKLEVNGTAMKYDGQLVPVFELDVFFSEDV